MFAKTRSRRRQLSVELLESRQLLSNGIIEIDAVVNNVQVPMSYFSLGGGTPNFAGNFDLGVLNAEIKSLGSAYQFSAIGGSSNWSGTSGGGTLSLSGGITASQAGSTNLTIVETEGGFDTPDGFNGTLASSSAGNFNNAGVGNAQAVNSEVNTMTNITVTPVYVVASKNTKPDPEGASAVVPLTELTPPYTLTNSIFFNLKPGADDGFAVATKVTATPAVLTVSANPQTKVYGAAVPPLTYNITGFVNGDTPSVVSGSPALATTATMASPVGVYPIGIGQGSLFAADYTFVFVNSALNVTPASLVVTANSLTKAYGAPVPTLTASYAGFVNGDTPASLTILPTLTTTATAASFPGNYPIYASGAVDNNYSISYVPGVLVVQAPAPVGITGITVAHLGAKHECPDRYFVIQFSGPLNPVDADNLANYSLVSLAGKKIALLSAVYNPVTFTVTLMTVNPLVFQSYNPLGQPAVRGVILALNPMGLLDIFGRPLSGTATFTLYG